MDFFLRGLIIGVSIAAPVGPIGLLCLQRAVQRGRLSGLMSGLGAATADAFYGGVAGFGIRLVSNFLLHERMWIHLIGGVLLLLLGMKGLFSKPAERAAEARSDTRGLWWNYLSTFMLTITNPMTILSFAAIFAALGVGSSRHGNISAVLTVLGVFLGSALWWFILSSAGGWMREKANATALVWIGRVSAVILMAFGILGIVTAGGSAA